jgi:hypothetical protein
MSLSEMNIQKKYTKNSRISRKIDYNIILGLCRWPLHISFNAIGLLKI